MSIDRSREGNAFGARRVGNICPHCGKSVYPIHGETDGSKDNSDNTRNIGGQLAIPPVIGWLVCIEGSQRGRDFGVMAKKNFLGSAYGMDIQILGDDAVSKRNHAVFIYDSKKRSTLLLPGEAHGLVYLNGEVVYRPMELSSYDTVGIGKSKFLFVPLCGEHFEWQEP